VSWADGHAVIVYGKMLNQITGHDIAKRKNTNTRKYEGSKFFANGLKRNELERKLHSAQNE